MSCYDGYLSYPCCFKQWRRADVHTSGNGTWLTVTANKAAIDGRLHTSVTLLDIFKENSSFRIRSRKSFTFNSGYILSTKLKLAIVGTPNFAKFYVVSVEFSYRKWKLEGSHLYFSVSLLWGIV